MLEVDQDMEEAICDDWWILNGTKASYDSTNDMLNILEENSMEWLCRATSF